MKTIAVATFCLVLFAVVSCRPDEKKNDDEKYTNEYDSIDLQEILDNDRARRGYINCLITGKKCTPDGQKLREIVPDALQTGCMKCSDFQKQQSKLVFRHTMKHHPEEYKELEKHFDPEHIYRTKYAKELKEEGIELPEDE